MTMKAQVYDIAPAQFRRTANAIEAAPSSIIHDAADVTEAVHRLANLAGFSERPRAFILTLLAAALSRDNSLIELFDEQLADLQNCSVKTVQRQRSDDFAEARARRLHMVEIVEGDYDKSAGKNLPTRYRFHLAGAVERVVTLARASAQWHETDRQKQREAIARAAGLVFDEIPRAETRARKKRKPRPAAAEIETCMKVASAKLKRAQQIASKLPERTRVELLGEEDPRELRRLWREMCAAIDSLFEDSLQTSDGEWISEGGGQFVSDFEDEDGFKSGASDEQRESWRRSFGHVTEPRVMGREVAEPAEKKNGDEELTVKEVARMKGVKPRTVYDWVRENRIPHHYTPGGRLRFYRRHAERAPSESPRP